ncbi:hypothetical protein HanXRQr2_Chr12g0558061 [Helianthus annuus]|nr:hypothetical protein HanXRQr2_Chr12g0558061 [Helianthus annuus]
MIDMDSLGFKNHILVQFKKHHHNKKKITKVTKPSYLYLYDHIHTFILSFLSYFHMCELLDIFGGLCNKHLSSF